MSGYYYFMVEGRNKPMGYVHHSTLEDLYLPADWDVNHEERLLTLSGKDGFKERTSAILATLRRAIDGG